MQRARGTARLGLGMAALGRPGYITLGHGEDLAQESSPEAMQQRAFVMLDAAYEHGVRYVDAARSYGNAEAFLAAWLAARQRRPGELRIGSKWGYAYTAGWQAAAAQHEVKDHSLQALQRQYPESRALLGGHLGLYQIHSATKESGVLRDAAVLDELARLRAGGLKIGLSVSGPAQAEVLRQALEITRDGARLFSSVQATWNLLERSCEEALQEAHALGLSVIIKEALANGRLTARGEAKQLAPLQELATQTATTIDAVALAAALAQPWAEIVLSGALTPTQLSENLRAASLDLNKEELGALGFMREAPTEYWTYRARLPWT